jgi:gluconate 5-dehydrogenase
MNLSSGVVRIGFADTSLYGVAKAGVTGLTRALAAEVGPSGINANAVATGTDDTGMQVDTGSTPEEKQAFISNTSYRRWCM